MQPGRVGVDVGDAIGHRFGAFGAQLAQGEAKLVADGTHTYSDAFSPKNSAGGEAEWCDNLPSAKVRQRAANQWSHDRQLAVLVAQEHHQVGLTASHASQPVKNRRRSVHTSPLGVKDDQR